MNKRLSTLAICLSIPASAHADNFSDPDCPPTWQPLVQRVDDFNAVSLLGSEFFLFMGPDRKIYNCLDVGFTIEYLDGLQTYVSTRSLGLSPGTILEDTGSTLEYYCGVTKVKEASAQFYIVRLPYDRVLLDSEECADVVERVLELTFDD